MKSELDTILARVRQDTGVDLSGYRGRMLDRRLAVRMDELGVSDPADYLRVLETRPSECDRFIDTVGVNVSSFFRDPLVFEIIHADILPGILERKRQAASSEIRVWSAGCGAGEEAYSTAILLHLSIEDEPVEWAPRIFATDIDEEALRAAGVGRYPRESFRTTKLGILDEYFAPSGPGFEVCRFIKDMVHFSRHDLMSTCEPVPPDSVFGTFDLVLCRNTLIYFSRDTQTRVLGSLCASLARGGYLILGDSEYLGREAETELETMDRRNRVFRRPLH